MRQIVSRYSLGLMSRILDPCHRFIVSIVRITSTVAARICGVSWSLATHLVKGCVIAGWWPHLSYWRYPQTLPTVLKWVSFKGSDHRDVLRTDAASSMPILLYLSHLLEDEVTVSLRFQASGYQSCKRVMTRLLPGELHLQSFKCQEVAWTRTTISLYLPWAPKCASKYMACS